MISERKNSAGKRSLEKKDNEPAAKNQKGTPEQKAPKTASSKKGQKIEDAISFVDGDKSVPKGWKMSTRKEEDGRTPIMCPQVFSV